jgi:hypothetical protein
MGSFDARDWTRFGTMKQDASAQRRARLCLKGQSARVPIALGVGGNQIRFRRAAAGPSDTAAVRFLESLHGLFSVLHFRERLVAIPANGI